jgi:hypothetical protein
MFSLENYVEGWERQNWLLLYRLGLEFRRKLRRLLKFKYRAINLAVFIVYISITASVRLAKALLYFGGLQERRFYVSPEWPTVTESEHKWALQEKLGPNVFFK